jgi:hypothetical protein
MASFGFFPSDQQKNYSAFLTGTQYGGLFSVVNNELGIALESQNEPSL